MRNVSLGFLGAAASALLLSMLMVQESSANEGQKSADGLVPAAILKLSGSDQSDGKSDSGRLIFGSSSTTTYTGVSLSTSTVFLTCLSGTGTQVCEGRRKRRDVKQLEDLAQSEMSPELEGSIDEEDGKSLVPAEVLEENKGNEKLAFTVWTTSRTVTTITTTSTNDATTIRVSIYCLAGNIQLPNFPC
ncbi:hypothetical protein O3P69_002090 [Scylla paramamosain]|uniref:Uncharacterized protein n=1 Tax=Scylla paramamosain TaxID=85552 RepID=A0AAW0V4R8_SCYPA